MLTNVWVLHPDASGPSMKGLLRYHYFAKNIDNNYKIKIFSSSKIRNSNVNLIPDEDETLYIEKFDDGVEYVFVKTDYYEVNDKNRVKNWLSYYRNSIRTANNLIKNGDIPDVLIGSSPHPLSMLAAIKIGKKYNIPVVNEVRDFWPEVFFINGRVNEKSLIGKLMLLGEKYIYNNSDSLIFLKEGDYNYIIDKKWDIDNGGSIDLRKIYYINNGVDLDNFDLRANSTLDDKDLNNDSFKCIYTGSLRMVNNIDNILDAAKILSEYKDIVFLIYGDGEYKDKLLERITKENISNVKLKGYVDNKYIPYILSRAGVNILNYSDKYSWERGNSSNKIFEYMASGKPIISTVKMGYSFIKKYNIGLELEENNPKNLADAIVCIKDKNKSEYELLCRNARKASEDFDYKNLSVKLKDVIDQSIGGKR